MDTIIQDAKDRMAKALASLEKEFSHLRTGRASTALLDGVRVDYYGTPTPVTQIASVTIPDSRTITIQPWEKASFQLIEKAIQKSDLGLSPVNDGKCIRVGLPPLTEERRKDLVKVAKRQTEEAKVAMRNVRRDANDAFKKKLKAKELTEDEVKKGEANVQKLTDESIAKADKALAAKEKEIMEI